MTGAPASRLGLVDRGLVRDSAAADLVVFDPAPVRSNATYDEPRRFPDGIDWVVVAVMSSWRRGGTLVRSGRVLTSHA